MQSNRTVRAWGFFVRTLGLPKIWRSRFRRLSPGRSTWSWNASHSCIVWQENVTVHVVDVFGARGSRGGTSGSWSAGVCDSLDEHNDPGSATDPSGEAVRLAELF